MRYNIRILLSKGAPAVNQTSGSASFAKKSKRGILRIIFGRTMLVVVLMLLNFFLTFSLLFEVFQGIPIIMSSLELFTAVMLIYVLNTRDNPSIKLSWCVVIAILPLLGAVLYLFVRFDLGHRLNKRLVESSIQVSEPFVPEQTELMDRVKEEDKDLYNLAYYLRRHGNFPIYSNTTVQYFPLGEDKFREMLIQLEKAERFIFMEYFLISEGYMWGKILDVLERKAKQGVEVRVMYDGMNAFYNLPYGYPKQLEKLGIKCKMFSPIRPFVSTHYNNRDHRKILVIDGHTAFTGGVNLEDRYINKETIYGHWKDTAVMVQGDAAQGFTLMFLQMWNAMELKHNYLPYMNPPKTSEPAEGYVIAYGDTPTDQELVGEMVYLNMLNQAKGYVYIMTPYLILDNETLTALQFAAKRGVDVRLILPHIPDKKTVFAFTRSHYKELIDAGVKIYEYTPGFVHAKVFLSDDKHAVVGSINLDYRSLYHHFECAAYLYKVPALRDMEEDFRQTMAKSQRITLQDVQRFSLFPRLFAGILKFLSPLV